MATQHRNALAKLLTFVLVLLCLFCPAAFGGGPDAADLLTYDELTQLYDAGRMPSELEEKLGRLRTTPFVDNSLSNSRPRISTSTRLGEYIRVAEWNVERGIEYEALEAVFESDERLAAMLDPARFPEGSDERRRLFEQAAALRSADVIVLNEVDWGLQRSDYRNVTAELAKKLGMNYAFGIEFVELTPIHLNGMSVDAAPAASEVLKLDPSRYKGLHGTAILSRFPLDNVRLVPFKFQPYDWFEGEKEGVSFVENIKRTLTKQLFLAEAFREVRRGGRMMLIADITDPAFPAGRISIVGTHLESRTSPRNRELQLRELLSTIKDIPGPVVVAGDMNTTSSDMTPTTVQRELKMRFGKVQSWVKTGLNYFLGMGMIQNAASASLTFGRTHGDPTVRHIPIFMPNEERKFFSTLKAFRFADKGVFDFRGEPLRASNAKRNTLANSNERDKKGFVTTMRLPRPIKFLGRGKLDWIFVKPVHLFDPSDYQGSYLLAPHFGRTLGDINSVVESRISDHSPLIVDLPLAEPRIEKRAAKK